MKNKLGTWLLYFPFFTLCLAQAAFAQTTYQVAINTAAVQGRSGKLAIDFTNGDPISNTLSILNFSTDGTMGLPETQGGLVQGDIVLRINPAPLTTIEDDFFFNQLSIPFTSFGSQITFSVQLTQNRGASGFPDQLTVFLLHTVDQPMIGTTDPLRAHALFAVDVTGVSGGALSTFSPAQFGAPSTITLNVPSLSAMAAAILPSSRSVQVGTPATAFVTIINAGSSAAVLDARPLLTTPLPATFLFQTTNPATNAVVGLPNAPVDIAPGAIQTYVIALTPASPITPTDVVFSFIGGNGLPPSTISGVNTLLFSAEAGAIPDIVALAATASNDGIVNIPGATGTGAFAVATVNVGAGGLITASADTGTPVLPVTVNLCETNPATGQCISGVGPSVTTQIDANETPTFGIFIGGTAVVPFDPATNRIFVRFRDGGGVTRGATSVAVRTQ
jgi:hypothetical protein